MRPAGPLTVLLAIGSRWRLVAWALVVAIALPTDGNVSTTVATLMTPALVIVVLDIAGVVFWLLREYDRDSTYRP